MIKVVYAADLFRRPTLAASMFRDRASQFHDRLRWQVQLDDQGLEFDQYDDLNPLYVIMHDEKDRHIGSGRLMPTTGRTMLNEHFSDLTGGVTIESPLIWETTRFCVSPALRGDRAESLRTSAALLWAGCDIAIRSGVEFYAGVFMKPMLRVYKAAGWNPEVLGERYTREGDICVGLWEVTTQTRDRLAERAGFHEIGVTTPLEYFPTEDRFPTFEAIPGAQTMKVAAELASYL